MTFHNDDVESHTVTVDGERVSDAMEPGDTFSITFDEPGDYDLGCDFHPDRERSLTVE